MKSIKAFFNRYRKKYTDTHTFDNGGVYDGEFSFGKIKGNGTYTLNNQKFIGYFKDSETFSGYTVDAYGNKLEGDFIHFKLVKGTITNTNLSKLQGNFNFETSTFTGIYNTSNKNVKEELEGSFTLSFEHNLFLVYPKLVHTYNRTYKHQVLKSIFTGIGKTISYKESSLSKRSFDAKITEKPPTSLTTKPDGSTYINHIIEFIYLKYKDKVARVWAQRTIGSTICQFNSYLKQDDLVYAHLRTTINSDAKDQHTFYIFTQEDTIVSFHGDLQFFIKSKLSYTFKGIYYLASSIVEFDGTFSDEEKSYTIEGVFSESLRCVSDSFIYKDKQYTIKIHFSSNTSTQVTRIYINDNFELDHSVVEAINNTQNLNLRLSLKKVVSQQTTKVFELEELKKIIQQYLRQLPKPITSIKTKKYQGYTFDYYSCFTYFSKNKYSSLIPNNSYINHFTQELYKFKDGKTTLFHTLIAELIKQTQHIENKNLVFCIIPASTHNNNIIRYQNFCNYISNYLKITDGYNFITREVEKEKSSIVGKTNTDPLIGIALDPSLKGKNIILFDDVITRGESIAKINVLLLKHGVKSVTNFTLAHTFFGELTQQELLGSNQLCKDLYQWIVKINN
ncbi:hypothetical protein AS361_17495 [Myroides marinus]|uniref:hypothetical protein n=1 Tax=Myroides marinus TaxID=703342 RepID=UPI000741D36F|nr:hypothetical protein [Myroides marinus]KUF41650.1 hypothetical protein AS361_17495 [Myroides marinus]